MVAATQLPPTSNEPRRLRLLPWQKRAWLATAPAVATVTPVGEGKSFFGAHWLVIKKALRKARGYFLAAANSHRQVERVVLKNLLACLTAFGISYTHRVQAEEIVLHLPEGSPVIWLASLNSDAVIERLRGIEIDDAWIDEARDCSEYAYQVVIGRLRGTGGPGPRQCLLTTTPSGRNWLYRLFLRERHAVDESGGKLRCLVHVTSRTNRHLPAGYDANLRGNYDEQLAAQELGAEFVNIGQGYVYRSFDRETHVRGDFNLMSGLPVYLGWDYGVDPQPVIVMQTVGVEPRALDEITDHGDGGIYWICDEFARRYPPVKRLRIFDDANHGRRRRESDSRTFRAVVKEGMSRHGISVDFGSGMSNPNPSQRYASTNRLFRDANGVVRYHVHPRCKELILDYEECVWRADGSGIDKSDQRRTHHSDAADYPLFVLHRPDVFRDEPGYSPDGAEAA